MCQENARPALAGYEYNRKAKAQLKQFMKDWFRHSLYRKVLLLNADEDDLYWDYEPYVSPDEATVSWDPDRQIADRVYALDYNHLFWCCTSCGTACNLTNRANVLHIACLHEGDSEAPLHRACGEVDALETERYVHNQACTSGCNNRCVE